MKNIQIFDRALNDFKKLGEKVLNQADRITELEKQKNELKEQIKEKSSKIKQLESQSRDGLSKFKIGDEVYYSDIPDGVFFRFKHQIEKMNMNNIYYVKEKGRLSYFCIRELRWKYANPSDGLIGVISDFPTDSELNELHHKQNKKKELEKEREEKIKAILIKIKELEYSHGEIKRIVEKVGMIIPENEGILFTIKRDIEHLKSDLERL